MPDLTVAQNIMIGREPRRGAWLDERRLNRQVADHLDELGMRLDPGALVGSLTVARQQMVEIAKALVQRGRVLIMDEPTAALTHSEVEGLHELIRNFLAPDRGVIYISHRLEELSAISHRVSVIRDGRNVGTVDTATAGTDEIIAMMVGRAIDTEARPENVRPDREPVLEVTGLSTKALLREVTFSLQRGEILGLAGLMGAGRTELARALVGADPISAGSVRLHGRPVTITDPAQAAQHRIGYLSEDRKRFGLLLDQDVSFNSALSALGERFTRRGFVRDKQADEQAEASVGTLRIRTPSIRQQVKNLSGGNQQKVVIAKWLAKDCDVLIFDEPTRGIDVGAKDEIYRLLNELARQGKSILMISSELPEILRMSHRVLVMCEGRVTGTLHPEEATQERIMHLATAREAAPQPTHVAPQPHGAGDEHVPEEIP